MMLVGWLSDLPAIVISGLLDRSRSDFLLLHIGKLLKTDKPAITEYLPNPN